MTDRRHDEPTAYADAARRRSSEGSGPGPISSDEALAWAVRLADMPPHAQEQELARVRPPPRGCAELS